ncbi:hypothetical protein C8R45DRAFT_1215202, partial [Mycena sanguinolenta]
MQLSSAAACASSDTETVAYDRQHMRSRMDAETHTQHTTTLAASACPEAEWRVRIHRGGEVAGTGCLLARHRESDAGCLDADTACIADMQGNESRATEVTIWILNTVHGTLRVFRGLCILSLSSNSLGMASSDTRSGMVFADMESNMPMPYFAIHDNDRARATAPEPPLTGHLASSAPHKYHVGYVYNTLRACVCACLLAGALEVLKGQMSYSGQQMPRVQHATASVAVNLFFFWTVLHIHDMYVDNLRGYLDSRVCTRCVVHLFPWNRVRAGGGWDGMWLDV